MVAVVHAIVIVACFIDYNPKPIKHQQVLQGMLISRVKPQAKPVLEPDTQSQEVVKQAALPKPKAPEPKKRIAKVKPLTKPIVKEQKAEAKPEQPKLDTVVPEAVAAVEPKPDTLQKEAKLDNVQPKTKAEEASAQAEREANRVIPPRIDAALGTNPSPPYPRISRRLKEEGTVLLDIYILANGQVGEMQIKQSSGYARLDQAARAAVAKWRYQPARKLGREIAYWYVQPIYFSLNDSTRF